MNQSARKRLTWLLIVFIALVALIGGAKFTNTEGATLVPELALDLQGGTQIILKPNIDGGQTASAEQLLQAVDIIRQRIDSTGVSEAQIVTQGEGRDAAIVVSIPGTPSETTLELIRASAKLEFRPVLVTGVGATSLVTPGVSEANPSPTPTLPPSTPVATSTGEPVDNSDSLPFHFPEHGVHLEDLEQSLIRQALQRARGNRSRAARLLGLTRDTLLYRIKKYAIVV